MKVEFKNETVFVNAETKEVCMYKKASCNAINGIIVWPIRNLCYLQLTESYTCKQEERLIKCKHEDFEITGNKTICNSVFITISQGIYLQESKKQNLTKQEFYFNAAIIQHLQDEIELLKQKIICIAVDVIVTKGYNRQ